jgi:hypothetical protein
MQKDLVDERRKTSEQAYLETNELKSRNGGFVEGCSVTKQSQSSSAGYLVNSIHVFDSLKRCCL